MKNTLIISIAFLATSCQTILMGALGIKQPQTQTNATVQKYASRHFVGHNSFRVDSIAMNTLFHQVYKPNWEPGLRPIQFICFAPDGKIVAQWASCEGNLKRTLSTYPPKSEFASDSLKKFFDFVQSLSPVLKSDNSLRLHERKNTYIVYWAIWTGRQSTKLVNELEDYVIKNGGSKEDIYLINTDIYKN